MKATPSHAAAFPRPLSKADDGAGPEFSHAQSGMTMREWYAGQALTGILAGFAGTDEDLPHHDKAARWAFQYADAMLAQAAKPQEDR